MATATKEKKESANGDMVPATFEKRRRSLYELIPDLAAIAALIEEAGGELDGKNGATLERWMNDLGDEIGPKLDGYIYVIRNSEADAAACRAEGEQFMAEANLWLSRARVLENVGKRLKERLRDWMTLTEQPKLETAKGRKLSVQANGGADTLDPDTLDPKDPELAKFVRTVQVIDTDALLAAMKTGQTFERARCKPKGTHLRIT